MYEKQHMKLPTVNKNFQTNLRKETNKYRKCIIVSHIQASSYARGSWRAERDSLKESGGYKGMYHPCGKWEERLSSVHPKKNKGE